MRVGRALGDKTTWLVGALALIAVATPQHYRDDIRTANEATRVYSALAIVDHGTVHLDPVFDDEFPGWRQQRKLPSVDVAYRDGHYLLDKGPGVTLLALPVVAAVRVLGVDLDYAALAWLLTLVVVGLPLVGFLLWLRVWLARNFASESPAPLVAPALVLASPLLVYGGLLFSHALAAVVVGAGAIAALGGLRAGQSALDRRIASAGGALLGVAVLVEYSAAIMVVIVIVALAIDRRERLLWVVLGGLAPAIVLAVWNAIAFGSPWSLSYGHKATAEMAATHARGLYGIDWPSASQLWGLLVSARRGLFFLSPWLLAGVAGAVWMALDRRVALAWRLVVGAAVVVVPVVLSGFGDWAGGRALGPRYLLFATPLMAIAVAYAVDRVSRNDKAVAYLYAVMGGLVGSSLLVNSIGAYGFPYLSERLTNPLFEVNLPVLLNGGPGPTVWDGWLGAPAGLLIALAAGVGAFAIVAVVWARRGGVSWARRNTLMAALAVAVGFAHVSGAALIESPSGARRLIAKERQFTHMFLGHAEHLQRPRISPAE